MTTEIWRFKGHEGIGSDNLSKIKIIILRGGVSEMIYKTAAHLHFLSVHLNLTAVH